MVLVQVGGVDHPVASGEGVGHNPGHDVWVGQAGGAEAQLGHPVAGGELEPVVGTTLFVLDIR